MPEYETTRGKEFQKRAAALAAVLKAGPVPGAVLSDYLEFLTKCQRDGVGPGTAAEINAVLWEEFPPSNSAGVRRIVEDLSAMAVQDFRLLPDRPGQPPLLLSYYKTWDEERKPKRLIDALFNSGCPALLGSDLLAEGTPGLEMRAELLLRMAEVAQYLEYTAELARDDLKAALAPGSEERRQPLAPQHYLRFQLLKLAEEESKPAAEKSTRFRLEDLDAARGRTKPPSPEDPRSIVAAVRRWAATDPFCNHLFRVRWGWLEQRSHSYAAAATDEPTSNWKSLSAADPVTKLAQLWEDRAATPEEILLENTTWLRPDAAGEAEPAEVEDEDDDD